MKKIFFILVLVFLLTSCFGWDYIENENKVEDNIYNEEMSVEEKKSYLIMKEDKINEYNKDMLVYWVGFFRDENQNNWFNWDTDLCINNPKLLICELIYGWFFYNEFYNSCVWNKDIKQCDSLVGEEKIYCESDFYLMELISTKNQNVCKNFKNNFDLWFLMGSNKYKNDEFCNKLYNDILINDEINENIIKKFVDDLDVLDNNSSSVENILQTLLLEKENPDINFKDFLKTEYRKHNLSCDELKNPEYILEKLKWIKYIFDTKTETLESYESLWIDR